MKIALYNNLRAGGGKREAYEFARQLLKGGHTVHIYAPSTAYEWFLSMEGIAQAYYRFELDLVPPIGLRLPALRKYLDLVGLLVNLRRLDRCAKMCAELICEK